MRPVLSHEEVFLGKQEQDRIEALSRFLYSLRDSQFLGAFTHPLLLLVYPRFASELLST